MADGQRISEDLQVLESFCESGDWAEQKPFLLALAGMIGAILKQESIACAIDGRMEIVTPIGGEGSLVWGNEPAAASERLLTNLVLQHLASDRETTDRS